TYRSWFLLLGVRREGFFGPPIGRPNFTSNFLGVV
ncbi:MAG: hypothetical protein ACI90V_010239, partial [Bacillariaceae sp.]